MYSKNYYNENKVINDLKLYLPTQAPLKDFISENTLAPFQDQDFEDALTNASHIFGYKLTLTLEEFRAQFRSNQINETVIERIITKHKGSEHINEWKNNLLTKDYDQSTNARIGLLRRYWKDEYHIELDFEIQPTLFRILCSYLDQGISIWNFPVCKGGFLESLREIEKNTFTSFFKTPRAKRLFFDTSTSIQSLLDLIVGDESLYERYLFDQQFSHPGWSGMVVYVENKPESLLDTKFITLKEVIIFELLLEIDALDSKFGEIWTPLHMRIKNNPTPLFNPVQKTELNDVLFLWQEAYEWTYFDQVLIGIKHCSTKEIIPNTTPSFQSMFCIDDRECSIRRNIELVDPNAATYGTAGFYNVEFYFQPDSSKFNTKVAPAPMDPQFIIKETSNCAKRKKDAHFNKHSHDLTFGWLISQTLGFWSALQLALNIFRPTLSPATSSSFRHMEKTSSLSIEFDPKDPNEGNLQVGFTLEQMAQRTEGLLRSIGLVNNFAPLVYIFGHGSTSVNNTHYAAYGCGACSGRPGSVNARVAAYMANHPEVRKMLLEKGIHIPVTTQFLGGLHDTCRDEILFYDEKILTDLNQSKHAINKKNLDIALSNNAKERAVKFDLIDIKANAKKVHQKVKKRSVSLFEPRPEFTHINVALCVVGDRQLTQKLFLDRRSFLNSYDYKIDPKGDYLVGIMNAVAPVCGGINLQYYFSRVDNRRLGAGSKLAHNVMGLFGVANGTDGDLRTGLPNQMVDIHSPRRLMSIVEHYPEVIIDAISRNPKTYQWFDNEWIHLACIHPESKDILIFKKGQFVPYTPLDCKLDTISNFDSFLTSNLEPHPVHLIN